MITNEEILVRTKDLTKKFGEHVTVNNVNIEISKGQIFGFLGPNGAGKTTTIRMLLGLMKPTSGTLEMFGKSLGTHRIDILKKVGSLVESPSYYRNLTGYENLEVVRRILDIPVSEIDRVLEIVRLTEAAHQLVRNYSLGMRQRLGIAMALIGRPELLILDEPTNGLDPAGIHEIRELIMRLPKYYGITVLISSHNLNEIDMIATHVGIIQKGTIIFKGSIEELRQKSKPMLEIKINQTEHALDLLNRKGFQANRKEDLLYLEVGEEQAAGINRELVEAGFDVTRLLVRTKSLEDIFLELTEWEDAL